MSFTRPGSPALMVLLAASVVGVLLVAPAGAAPQAVPQLSGLKARVAQGGRVDLAAPALTAGDLARLRPDFEKLKPRPRTNAE